MARSCEICNDYGFTCRQANFIEQITGREKVVILNKDGRQFAHDFPIEDCEVVKGEVSAEKYAKTLIRYIDARDRGIIID